MYRLSGGERASDSTTQKPAGARKKKKDLRFQSSCFMKIEWPQRESEEERDPDISIEGGMACWSRRKTEWDGEGKEESDLLSLAPAQKFKLVRSPFASCLQTSLSSSLPPSTLSFGIFKLLVGHILIV